MKLMIDNSSVKLLVQKVLAPLAIFVDLKIVAGRRLDQLRYRALIYP
jgi:hypothetical protein